MVVDTDRRQREWSNRFGSLEWKTTVNSSHALINRDMPQTRITNRFAKMPVTQISMTP
jgi:hypothetical protein